MRETYSECEENFRDEENIYNMRRRISKRKKESRNARINLRKGENNSKREL